MKPNVEDLPNDLKSFLGKTEVFFILKSKKSKPFSDSIPLLIFFSLSLILISVFLFSFFIPILSGEVIQAKINGEDSVVSMENPGGMLIPFLICLLFGVLGIGSGYFGLKWLIKKGGWFVGTPEGIIHFTQNNLRTFAWDEITDQVEMRKRFNQTELLIWTNTTDRLSFLRSSNRFIYISGIADGYSVLQMLKSKIKEMKSLK